MEDNKPSVKIEIQTGETVLFKGKKASVTSVFPDGTYVILQDGMTIETTKSSLTPVNKTDTMEKQFKFDEAGKLLDEHAFVKCTIDGLPMFEQAYVDFREYMRKRNNMKVKLVNECGEPICAACKADVTLSEIPEELAPAIEDESEEVDIHGTVDGVRDSYVHGVVLGPDGEATRKIMIDPQSYASAEDDDAFVDILYIEEDGYKHGKLKKHEISTLSV